jgi:hypothetical protein
MYYWQVNAPWAMDVLQGNGKVIRRPVKFVAPHTNAGAGGMPMGCHILNCGRRKQASPEFGNALPTGGVFGIHSN